jgi:hypothetical protein
MGLAETPACRISKGNFEAASGIFAQGAAFKLLAGAPAVAGRGRGDWDRRGLRASGLGGGGGGGGGGVCRVPLAVPVRVTVVPN